MASQRINNCMVEGGGTASEEERHPRVSGNSYLVFGHCLKEKEVEGRKRRSNSGKQVGSSVTFCKHLQ